MIEEADSLLVRQCLRGDTRAFGAIVEKYEKTMFNVVIRMVNNYEDAQDIAQSAFVKAYEKLRTFDSKYKFFSWLYRIVVNESLNFLDQKRNFEKLDESLISKEKTPEEAYDRVEAGERIRDALLDLKLEYRTVLVLKHFQNLSYQEISYIVDVPQKTVKARLFTARQLLREILLKKGI